MYFTKIVEAGICNAEIEGEVKLFIIKSNDACDEWVISEEDKAFLVDKLTDY